MARLLVVVAGLLSSLLSLSSLSAQFELPAQCEIPWKEIAVDREISQRCGMTGTATMGPGAAQNRMKNNICATNDPVSLRYTDFRDMQRRANQKTKKEKDFNFGGHVPIKNRHKLRDFYTTADGVVVGEGMVVRHVGFLAEARAARIGTGGESVNCKFKGTQPNDIHIDIVQRAGDSPCLSVTAEMIPHFRPDNWTPAILNRIRDQRLPVRVTGHLFFDSSHKPCTGKKSPGRGHPLRVSLWEIHPVYSFDVCKASSKAKCSETDDAMWISLHDWAR